MEQASNVLKSTMDLDSSDDERQPMIVRPANDIQKDTMHSSRRDSREETYAFGVTEQGQPLGVRPSTDPIAQSASFHGTRPEDFRLSRLSDGNADIASIDSSFEGSVTEMAIDQNPRKQPAVTNALRRKGHLPTNRAEPVVEEGQKPMILDTDRRKDILGAYQLTLLALQQNRGSESMTPPPLQAHVGDTHIPKQSMIASAADSHISSKPVRKVSVLTPAIDISRARSWKGNKPIPSPYPITRNRPIREQLASPRSDHSLGLRDSTLYIRLHLRHRGRPAKTVKVLIPPAQVADYSTIKTAPQKEKERHFRSLDYDDSSLGVSLRKAYATLVSSPYRLFAARSLVRITVSGPASKAADRAYGWLHPAAAQSSRLSSDRERRSPSASGYEVAPSVPFSPGRSAASADPLGFSEWKLLRLFCQPSSARSRYAWVGWARKIADVEDVRPGGGSDAIERVKLLTGQMEDLFRGLAEAVRVGAADGDFGASTLGNTTATQGLSPWSSRVPSLTIPGQSQRPGHQRASSARSWPGENKAPLSPAYAPHAVSTYSAKSRAGGREPDEEDFEGLIFVLGWNVWRIVLFLSLVLLVAAAAALLWIFLGPSNGVEFRIRTSVVQEGQERGGSIRGPEDRVGAGLVLGICTLLVGLTGFGTWLGVSWWVI